MTIQELFKSINKEEFIDLFLKNNKDTIDMLFDNNSTIEEKIKAINKFKKTVSDAFDECLMADVKPQSDKIVFVVSNDEYNAHGDSFYSLRDEILSYENIKRVERYAYEFVSRDEILGYSVSEATRHRFNDDVLVAVNIFNEMTFNGVSSESCKERSQDIMSQIDESLKEIKEKDSVKEAGISFEEFMKEIGYVEDRTEEEKNFDTNMMKIQGDKYSKIFTEYLKLEKYYIIKERKE